MQPFRKFNNIFQIRWAEEFGMPNAPYVRRWSLIIGGYSFRLHHWFKSDDNRFFHDHSCDLTSIVLKGWYHNVVPKPEYLDSIDGIECNGIDLSTENCKEIFAKQGSVWHAKAEGMHYIKIPKGVDVWTLVCFKRPHRKWGFWVNNDPKRPNRYVLWRPFRYYKKFGVAQTENYQ